MHQKVSCRNLFSGVRTPFLVRSFKGSVSENSYFEKLFRGYDGFPQDFVDELDC